uniref:general transcription factor IIF subunit 1 isoform X2 n=1 Tax=Myxine glutinosa TaxID=7769 RepID=UPI00358F964E
MADPASGSQTTTEYVVRVPRNSPKEFNIMAFNSGDNIDFSTWTHAKMEHDLSNKKIYQDEEKPEFGAGSEFRKKQREEARRKKFGFASKEFRVEDQPWSLRINGKAGRRFKGTKKGGVTENAAYYIFTKCADGAFEAFPLNSWYNFTRQMKHRTLSAEEAEVEWGRRNTVLNRFTIMLQKRLKDQDGDLDETDDGEVGKKGKKQKTKKGVNLKIHDMEEDLEMSSDSEAESNSEGEGGSKNSKEKSAGKGKKKKKKKKNSLESEALEESDDGDFEGAEVDYMSNDTSEEEREDFGKVKPDAGKEIPKGVDEEMGSSEDSEEENENDKEEDDGKKTPVSEKKEKKKKANASDSESSDDSDIDDTTSSAVFIAQKKKLTPPKRTRKGSGGSRGSSRGNSRPNTPTTEGAKTSATLRAAASKLEKGKARKDGAEAPAAKRLKVETPPSGKSTPNSGEVQLTEDAVRRYLSRKPMTTKDLLKKFQTKKTGLSSEQTVNIIAQILKRLNPDRKMINDKMHFFLKESS